MTELKTEYTDTRDVTHRVEHLTVTESSGRSREQILDELFTALTGKDKQIPV